MGNKAGVEAAAPGKREIERAERMLQRQMEMEEEEEEEEEERRKRGKEEELQIDTRQPRHSQGETHAVNEGVLDMTDVGAAATFGTTMAESMLNEDDNDDNNAQGESARETTLTKTKKRLPAEMRYFDTARVCIRSGDGGRGEVAFRREKHVARGGPSGGNGGHGGSVYVRADETAGNSLYSFRKRVHYRAANGVNGQGSSKYGANGADVEVVVPPGTLVRRKAAHAHEEEGEGEVVAELVAHGDRVLLLRGGKGGKGNEAFKSRANRTPQIAEKGEKGSEMWIDLELKVVADVGVIGMPNAGKSTFLAAISNAKPKIANYQFTTLVPNLGVCEFDDSSTLFADVPGLLEGAHTGLGLGQEFLRHCERARVLVHVLDGTRPDPAADMDVINEELRLFNRRLASKPQIVVVNKTDLTEARAAIADVEASIRARNPTVGVLSMSAATRSGVRDVVRAARSLLASLPETCPESSTELVSASTSAGRALNDSDARLEDFVIEYDAETRSFAVVGDAIERFVAMSNWEFWESVLRLQKVLTLGGISDALRSAGVAEGDTVTIGEFSFGWRDDESQRALYDEFMKDRSAGRGSKHWPHGG